MGGSMDRKPIPGFNSQEIKVSIEPHRLTISGKAEPHDDHPSGKHSHSTQHALFILRVPAPPAEVDRSKAEGPFNAGRLEVTMPKAGPARSVRLETRIESSAD